MTTNNDHLAEWERGLGVFRGRDLRPIGDYEPQVDWFYLEYRFRDWFGLRGHWGVLLLKTTGYL